MEHEDAFILDQVIGVVTRYGMKRVTMNDLAQRSGVSRQTLYDKYGDKDGIMAAAITLMMDRIQADLRAAFGAKQGLSDKIDAYFDVSIWPVYEVLQAMPDAADLERGLGPASVAASKAGYKAKQALLAEMLAEYLPPDGPKPADVAMFFEKSSSRAKMAVETRGELEQFLSVLKASVLALVRQL